MKSAYAGDIMIRCEADRLRKVLMSPPLEKYDVFHFDYYDLLIHDFIEMPDLKKARIQHERLVDIFKENGVEVEMVEPNPQFPNLCFVRDTAVITPQGAIPSSFCLKSRMGEEKIIASKLREIGIPVLEPIRPPGCFEGASCIYFCAGPCALIASSSQTNLDGIKQISEAVRSQGIDDIRIVEHADYHLDGVIGVVSHDTFVVKEQYKDDKSLRGFNVIPVPDELLATNVVLLRDWKVVAYEGAKESIRIMEKEGVDVIPADISEFAKMMGGPHCLTLDLDRKP